MSDTIPKTVPTHGIFDTCWNCRFYSVSDRLCFRYDDSDVKNDPRPLTLHMDFNDFCSKFERRYYGGTVDLQIR